MITEEEARKILAEAKSPAASASQYEAERLELGWSFYWSGHLNDMPVGAGNWVVTDSGKADIVGLGEKPDQALARLSENQE